MKKSLRIFAFVVFAISLFALLAISPSAESGNALRYGRQTLSGKSNGNSLIYVYDKLVSECSSCEQHSFTLDASRSVTRDEFEDVFEIFFNDYPEYFWLSDDCKYSYDMQTGAVTKIEPRYIFSKNQIIAMESELDAKVSELTSDLSGKSQYEKSLILHDRLASVVEYQPTANDQHVYGALIEGKAVCAGYARAYQLLLHKVGIPGWYVKGSGVNSSGSVVSHAWNLVSIDGKWYYTDVTWDDQGDTTYHAYLNLPYEVMGEDHTVLEFKEVLPNAVSTDANYFYKNQRDLASFDADVLANLLKTYDFNTSIMVTGDLTAFRKAIEATSNMSQVMKKTGVSYSSYSYSLGYLGREIVFKINVKLSGNSGDTNQHTHRLTCVLAKQPDCKKGGNITYYICNCGKYFADASAKQEITDKNSVLLSKTDHVPSESYKNDNNEHWLICKYCNNIVTSTIGSHTDGSGDHICDACGYNIPRQTESTTKPPQSNNDTPNNSDVPNDNDTPKDNETTITTDKPSDDDTPDSNDTPDIDHTSSDNQNTPTLDTDAPSDTPTDDSVTPGENDTEYEGDTEPEDNNAKVFIIAAGIVGAVGTAGAVGFVIVKKRI